VRKLLVDERYQRRGIARRLMGVLEEAVREHGSTLCVSQVLGTSVPMMRRVQPWGRCLVLCAVADHSCLTRSKAARDTSCTSRWDGRRRE
jgi:hypothetical protein